MNWQIRMFEYMYYFKETTYTDLDLEDLEEFQHFISSFENFDFNEWLKENELEEDFKSYMYDLGYIIK